MRPTISSEEWGNTISQLSRECAEHGWDLSIAMRTLARDGVPFLTPMRPA